MLQYVAKIMNCFTVTSEINPIFKDIQEKFEQRSPFPHD